MAEVNNCGISIFDLHKREHVFASYNFSSLFGYDMTEVEKRGNEYFNSKVHPDDLILLLKTGIKVVQLFFSLNWEERLNLKMINEYRIQNKDEKYIRVIEQHQALELDKKGNVWLSLGVIDISPNQDVENTIRSQVINFKNGNIIPLPPDDIDLKNPGIELSPRERQILGLIKDGHPSKEISSMLSISVHTVNTHRQRILGKLNADNSMEAVKYASGLGLLD
jgi:DNA-binding CsgD family transcriptional regulator